MLGIAHDVFSFVDHTRWPGTRRRRQQIDLVHGGGDIQKTFLSLLDPLTESQDVLMVSEDSPVRPGCAGIHHSMGCNGQVIVEGPVKGFESERLSPQGEATPENRESEQ